MTRLDGREPRDPSTVAEAKSQRHLIGKPVRAAHIANLAGSDEDVERLQGLFNRRGVVEHMNLKEVEVVRVEPT